jgi:glycosyltransferase involved in cell wall biosynthesis
VKTEKKITIAICTYNRAERLRQLITAVRRQECQIPCEILVVDNNSTDGTSFALQKLAKMEGAPLRFVKEERQGIVNARNRAIEEAMGNEYIAFIDDDEIPREGWLKAAVDVLDRENADCVGGEIRVNLPCQETPKWLDEDILGFLGEVKYAAKSFWITDISTPLWTGNIAYRLSLFTNDLRFDERYDRKGSGIGGGSDAVLFKALLERGARIRYRSEMIIEHYIDAWKIKRSYFLKLHFAEGKRRGRWEHADYKKTFLGVPPFMVIQLLKQCGRAFRMFLNGRGFIRQMMNVTYDLGMMKGRFQNWKKRRNKSRRENRGEGYHET